MIGSKQEIFRMLVYPVIFIAIQRQYFLDLLIYFYKTQSHAVAFGKIR